jgi:hypothetical protein
MTDDPEELKARATRAFEHSIARAWWYVRADASRSSVAN